MRRDELLLAHAYVEFIMRDDCSLYNLVRRPIV